MILLVGGPLGKSPTCQVTIDIVVVDMFLVVKEQDSTCSHLNPSLMFISKEYGLKAYGMSF